MSVKRFSYHVYHISLLVIDLCSKLRDLSQNESMKKLCVVFLISPQALPIDLITINVPNKFHRISKYFLFKCDKITICLKSINL